MWYKYTMFMAIKNEYYEILRCSFCFHRKNPRLCFLFHSNGKAQLKAVLAELLHNEREWEAEEESTASEPRESSPSFWAETEAVKAQQSQCCKHCAWSESQPELHQHLQQQQHKPSSFRFQQLKSRFLEEISMTPLGLTPFFLCNIFKLVRSGSFSSRYIGQVAVLCIFVLQGCLSLLLPFPYFIMWFLLLGIGGP